MSTANTVALLRNIAFHAQPLALVRPSSPAREPALSQPAQRAGQASAKPNAAEPPVGYDEGYAKGYDEGRRAGVEKGLAEAVVQSRQAIEAERAALQSEVARREGVRDAESASSAQELGELREKFSAALAAGLAQLERDTVALTFEALCRIVGEAEGQAEWVARSVRTSMQALRAAKLLRIRLRPDDLDRLSLSAEGRALTLACDAVEWVADPSVLSGGCLFDTDLGRVDARMEVQLDALRRAWANAAGRVDALPGSGQQ